MADLVTPRRRSHVGLVLAGLVVVAAGFAVAAVELLRLPKGSVWIVVAGAVALAGSIRAFTKR